MFEGKLSIEAADQMFKCSHSAVISTSGPFCKAFSYISLFAVAACKQFAKCTQLFVVT